MLNEIFINQQLNSLGLTNFLRYAIHWLVSQGFSLELLILVLLLPLSATLMAFVRYFVGLQGLGIFAPLMMGVIFLSTGLVPGVILFLFILLIEVLFIYALRSLKIHFLAKMALILLIVCLGFFLILLLVPKFNLQPLFNFSLIPILVLIILGENLAEIQVRTSFKSGLGAVIETLILATLVFFVLSATLLRKMMLLYPEAMILMIVVLDLAIGHFSGKRLLEYRRFKHLLKK